MSILLLCKYLTVYFLCRLKNKLNVGIAFPAFILGGGNPHLHVRPTGLC
jgi:hypothetical protein